MQRVCLFENGRLNFMAADECRIAANDSGANFGDGIYEVIAAINGRFIDFEGHIERLQNSLAGIKINLPSNFGLAQIKEALIKLLEENGADKSKEGYVYFRISRGSPAERDFKITETIPSFYAEWHEVKLYKQQTLNEGEKALIFPDTRWAFRNLKTLQLMPSRIAKAMAEEAGANDVIFINRSGIITEGGSTNVFIVKNKEILTYPINDNAILPGITRMRLIKLARESGYRVREEAFTLADLLNADEIFRSSTSLGARGITEVVIKQLGQVAELWQPDAKQIGAHKIGKALVGEVTRDLGAQYANFARNFELGKAR